MIPLLFREEVWIVVPKNDKSAWTLNHTFSFFSFNHQVLVIRREDISYYNPVVKGQSFIRTVLFVNTTNVKFSISQMTERLKFINEIDKRFSKIVREIPKIEIMVKSVFLKPNSEVLMLNCGFGVLGLVFASINQRTKFFLYDFNIQMSNLRKKI